MSDLEIIKTYGVFDNPFNGKLLSDLKLRGEDVLVFPTVEAKRLDLTETEAGFLRNLSDFEWLILTDVFAADRFIESLNEFGTDFFELDSLTVCAVGEAVADRLRFVQVHADVIPSKTADETIFSAISGYAFSGLNDAKFLVVREKSAAFPFVERLKEQNASIAELAIYEAEFADAAATTKLKTLLAGGAVDEFVFSAPEDLASLRFLYAGADLLSILNETRVSAVGEIVFQSLQENGLRPLYFHRK